jgi:predicted GTPase
MRVAFKTGEVIDDEDDYAWYYEQAERLKHGGELDIEFIEEVLIYMGRSDERSADSQMERLIMHILKWEYQDEKRTPSWASSINNAVNELYKLFEQKTLEYKTRNNMEKIYKRARRSAAVETALPIKTFPEECEWSFDDLLNAVIEDGVLTIGSERY